MTNTNITFEKPHGDYSFPFSIYFTSNTIYKDIIYCHWHSDMEFLYVTEGSLSLQIDTNIFTINKGEAAIINSGQIHFGNSKDNSYCSAYAIVFDLLWLCFNNIDICQNKYISPFIKNKYKLPNHIKPNSTYQKEILKNMQNIINIAEEKSDCYELKVKAYLYLIFSEIISNNIFLKNENKLTQKQYRINELKIVLNYIHSNYKNKIYISDLAQLLNMGEDNFYKFFKALTSKTPIEYINFYRIKMAEMLIIDKNISLSEICYSVGFENISYFIKTFKKYNSCTPKEFRKANVKNLSHSF